MMNPALAGLVAVPVWTWLVKEFIQKNIIRHVPDSTYEFGPVLHSEPSIKERRTVRRRSRSW